MRPGFPVRDTSTPPSLGVAAAVTVAVALLAAACSSGVDTSEERIVAGVNVAIADVPLDEIIFDTFDGRSISLAEAEEEQIDSLLNVIPPIDDPVYVQGSGPAADWLTADDIVLGYIADDGTAWAHPHRVLNFHEIVNTTMAQRPVVVTYCPLCGSGVVFDRRPTDLRHDGVLTFDNTSALYESDMVMVDAETHTYWWQVSGRGLVGNLTGTELTALPSRTTSWAQWLHDHPDTMVLSNDQGRGPSYARDPFADYGTVIDSGRLAFPASPDAFADERLAPSTRVIGFDLAGEPAAVAVLSNERAVVELPGEFGQMVLLDGHGGGALFVAAVGGAPASFVVSDDGDFVDEVTGTVWNAAGVATTGPAVGEQLEAVPSRTAYWFAWVSTTDGQTTRLFGPDGEIEAEQPGD